MRALARFLVGQPVLTNILFFAVCIAGLAAYRAMPVEEYPNVSFDQGNILTFYRGASPAEVEAQVTKKIEEEIRDVEGVAFVRSVSGQDYSRVMVKFREDLRDFEKCYRQLETELAKVADLPEGCEKPVLSRIDVREMNPVIFVIVTGGAPEGTLRAVAKDVRDDLERLAGVSKVKVNGLRDRELRVLVDPELANHVGLTVGDVAAALAARNLNAPAGTLDRGGHEIVVRTRNEFLDLDEVRNTVCRVDPRGSFVRLSDVARLEWGFERQTVVGKWRGGVTLSLPVTKLEESNALDIADRVHEYVERWNHERAPAGITLFTVADTTVRIRDRVRVLLLNLLSGLAMVFGLLWLFVGFRNAMLASIAIPFEVLVALAILYFSGESINVISLFSLVFVGGILVDDAIVILEDVYRLFEEGRSLEEATVEGMAEVAWPVISSSLTTVAAFLPMLIMTGVTGRFFSLIPKVVTYALIASLFEAFFCLPSHIVDFGPRRGPWEEGIGTPLRLAEALRRSYRAVLSFCMRHRVATLAAPLVLTAAAFAALARVPVEFFPSEFSLFFVNVRMPPGTSLKETEAMSDRVAAAIDALPESEVKSCVATVGFLYDSNYQPHAQPHYAQLLVTLADAQRKGDQVEGVMAKVKEALARGGFLPARIDVERLQDGPPLGKPVTVRVRGDDLALVAPVAREVEGACAALPGVFGVQSDLEPGLEELRFSLLEDGAALHGVTVHDVAQALADANDGRVATVMSHRDEDVAIRVELDRPFRQAAEDLGEVRVRARASGALLPLREVARFDRARGYSAIHRHDGKRAVTITAEVDPRVTTSTAANLALARQLAHVERDHPGLKIEFAGEFEETNRSFDSLRVALLIALLAIYAILGTQFRSFAQPLLILLTVPFSFIGVVVGLLVTGDPFTVSSFIAIVGLAGMVVNNAIVLLDFVNAERAKGAPLERALLEAGEKRIRPILLTTVTTILGLLPTMLGLGGRSKVWSPMATSIVFGLSFATLLTLFVIPAAYLVGHDLAAFARRILGRRPSPDPAPQVPAAALR